MQKFVPGAAAALILAGSAAAGSVTVDYTADLGGNNTNALNGLAASATFDLNGNMLSILLENTSTGVPDGAEASDSLLVSLAFNLTNNVVITSGDSAVIGSGSQGLGAWSGLTAGDSVAEEWLYTNDAGGDFLEAFSQVISTSNGQGGGDTFLFGDNSLNPNVSGPFGGIAGSPALVQIPNSQEAVSNSILYTVTLSDTLSFAELNAIAQSSVVEFGSDYQYLGVPGPGVLSVLALAGVAGCGRRRRA